MVQKSVLPGVVGGLGDLWASRGAGWGDSGGLWPTVGATWGGQRVHRKADLGPSGAGWGQGGAKRNPRGTEEGWIESPECLLRALLGEVNGKRRFNANPHFPAGKPLILRVRAGSGRARGIISDTFWSKTEPLEA